MTVRLPRKEITLDESNDFRLQIADCRLQISNWLLRLVPLDYSSASPASSAPVPLCPCAPTIALTTSFSSPS